MNVRNALDHSEMGRNKQYTLCQFGLICSRAISHY